jgi:hypothetical protein
MENRFSGDATKATNETSVLALSSTNRQYLNGLLSDEFDCRDLEERTKGPLEEANTV